MYCFFYAIAHIALAQAMLLKMTAPLFMPFVALAWLGESIPGRVLGAVLLGFLGVALIVGPQPAAASSVALIAVLGGFLAALAKVTVRRLARTEPTVRIVFYFAVVGTLVSAVPLLWAWRTPAASSLLWMLAVGCFATLGQLLLTRGMALAPAGRLGVFAYSSAVFGAAYGWFFWQETILWSTAAGALLVALAGVMAGHAGKTGTIRAQPSPG
jgi:drug/metabolite transporter (DMT)-like permease